MSKSYHYVLTALLEILLILLKSYITVLKIKFKIKNIIKFLIKKQFQFEFNIDNCYNNMETYINNEPLLIY